MPDVRIPGGIMHVGGDFNPGDMPPCGYLDWHEWAEIQRKAGLRQVECGRCAKWKFPQELSEDVDECEAMSRRGPVKIITAVCLACATGARKADAVLGNGKDGGNG